MIAVYDRCSRCGLLMPTNLEDLCKCWIAEPCAENARLRAELAAANNRLAIQFGMHPGGDLAKGALVERERAVAAERERCAKIVEAKADKSVLAFAGCVAAAIRRSEPS